MEVCHNFVSAILSEQRVETQFRVDGKSDRFDFLWMNNGNNVESHVIFERLMRLFFVGYPFEINPNLNIEKLLEYFDSSRNHLPLFIPNNSRSRYSHYDGMIQTVFSRSVRAVVEAKYHERAYHYLKFIDKWKFMAWKPKLHPYCFGPHVHSIVKSVLNVYDFSSFNPHGGLPYLPLEMWLTILSFVRRCDHFQPWCDQDQDPFPRHKKLDRYHASLMTASQIQIRKAADKQLIENRKQFNHLMFQLG